MGECLEVVPTVRGALKSKHEVTAVDDGDVLVIVECPVESAGGEVRENEVIPEKEEREG